MKVHERIRSYIESQGMKFNHVAERSGVDSKKFYRLMDGSSAMTADEYERICVMGLLMGPEYFLIKSS